MGRKWLQNRGKHLILYCYLVRSREIIGHLHHRLTLDVVGVAAQREQQCEAWFIEFKLAVFPIRMPSMGVATA